MPPPERPGWFCFFPNWFGFDGAGFLQRVGSVRLLTPSIVDAEKVLAAADWSLAGAGDVPRAVGAGARVVDRLDVADVRSERAHAFAGNDGEPGASAGTFLRRAAFAPGDEAIDGGRTLLREARFALARDPAATATVIVRTPGGVHIRALVSVDGGPWERVEIRGAAGRFHEQAVARIAPGEGRAEIRLRVTDEAAASAPLVLTHVFAVVEADG
jgi:hypothetical protein